MSELEGRIIAMVSEETGVKAHRILLSSRLAHDLGMDGDDAVFIERFGREFNVDLPDLGAHWHKHFGPEGSGPPLGFLAVIGAAVILGDLLHRAFQQGPGWAWMITLFLVFGWAYSRFFMERIERKEAGTIPVTVSDLIDAVRAGRWVKHYDESATTFGAVE